jgi:hypothetical protein
MSDGIVGDAAVAPEAPAAPVEASVESVIAAPAVEIPAAASPPSVATPAPEITPPSPELPPIETPKPEIPQPSPAPQPVPPTNPTTSITIKDRLYAALEKIQFRKRAKLDKVLALAAKKRSIKNDDVEELLKVSDSTAQRYLNQLVREGKLRRSGPPQNAVYEGV